MRFVSNTFSTKIYRSSHCEYTVYLLLLYTVLYSLSSAPAVSYSKVFYPKIAPSRGHLLVGKRTTYCTSTFITWGLYILYLILKSISLFSSRFLQLHSKIFYPKIEPSRSHLLVGKRTILKFLASRDCVKLHIISVHSDN